MKKAIEAPKPSDNFRKAVRQILSVSKEELAKREREYRAERKLKPAKKHGG